MHHQVRDDLYFRDAIKNEVVLRKDARKWDDVDNSLVPKITATEVDFHSGQSLFWLLISFFILHMATRALHVHIY